MIPKILHQIWVGPNEIPDREFDCVFRMKDMHSDYDCFFWTDAEYPFDMPNAMKEQYDYHYREGRFAWCADILRIWVVYKYGGIYMDVDFDPIQRLDYFLPFNGFFCYHPQDPTDLTLVNGVFGMEADHPIMKHCAEQIKSPGWWYGPAWLGETVRGFFGGTPDVPSHNVKHWLTGNYGVFSYPWLDFDTTFAKHYALYSWRNQ